ncbi:hypothetical protein C4577_04890 [Candidatus Parcubacteria bacterium]|nr:MAG: hypothetical protein C4577_04890 [Candidatus Parcubacteria bacterium]
MAYCNEDDRVPYTLEDITRFMVENILNQGGEVEDWVNSEFERFKNNGRKLPSHIKKNTLRQNWFPAYKGRGRKGIQPFEGRVIRSSRTFS